MANPRKKKDFSRADLEKLGQPFRVTVHQDVGGRKTPVVLPPIEPGQEPGAGFTPDAAEKLGPVLPHLGGGGLYTCMAMDEAGNTIEWDWWFDPNMIPRKATEQLAAAGVPRQQAQQPVVMMATPMGPQPVAVAPSAGPAFGQFMQGLQQQHQQAAPVTPLHRAPQMMPSSPPPGDPFEDPLWKERELRLKLENEMKMQQAVAALEAQMTNKLRSLETMAQQAQRPASDPAADARMAAMESQLAQALKAAEDANRRADKAVEDGKRKEEREEMLGMIQAVNSSTQQAIATLTQTITAQAAARPVGPDPTTSLLIASVERQGEMYKSMLDLMGRNAEGATKNQMTLADVLTIMNTLNQQGGAGVVVGKMSEGMGTMVDMFRQLMELKSQMDGGGKGNPLLEIGGQAVANVAESVQAYLKERKETEVAKANVEISKSNAEAVKAQASAARDASVANANAQAIAGRQQQQGWATPPPAMQQPPAEAPSEAPVEAEAAPEDQGADGLAEAAAVEGASQPDDPREVEIFGPALKRVKQLRATVAEGTLTAMEIAQLIATAGAKIKALRLNVPVFRMYEEQMYAPVVEACLPDAPLDLRRQVSEILASVGREQLIIQAPAN